MRVLIGIFIALACLGAGVWLGQNAFKQPSVTLTGVMSNMQDDIVIEHMRDMVTWYRTCPERIHWHDFSPEILMIFPSTVRYKLPSASLGAPELIEGEWVVQAGPIIADKPIIDTNRQTSLADGKPLTNEAEYIAREVTRLTPIARYLALQQLQAEQALIQQRMQTQIEKLLQSVHFTAELLNQSRSTFTPDLNTETALTMPIVRVQWDELAQAEYLESAYAQLDAQPPFGIRGCSEDEWLQVNGNKTDIALIAPAKKNNPRGGAAKKPSDSQEPRYIVH